MSFYNTGPLEDGANDSCNYILNNLINGLAEESDNKDGKNIINKSKAENNNNRSNDSDDIDNDDSSNSNSSDSNKGDEACGYIKWQKLLTPITN